MEYGVEIWGDYDTVLDVARFAEDHSLTAVAVVDNYLMLEDEERAKTNSALDLFALLAGLARD